ncbi:MAG: hypothetical protein KHY27_01015 [Butyricicoccus pullicaecorum]|nr:hypothetical protein [Butyricicoccus pullicaecorum]
MNRKIVEFLIAVAVTAALWCLPYHTRTCILGIGSIIYVTDYLGCNLSRIRLLKDAELVRKSEKS